MYYVYLLIYLNFEISNRVALFFGLFFTFGILGLHPPFVPGSFFEGLMHCSFGERTAGEEAVYFLGIHVGRVHVGAKSARQEEVCDRRVGTLGVGFFAVDARFFGGMIAVRAGRCKL